MKILIIDGMNFVHRARAGFHSGENSLIFHFFRNLRAQVEFHNPDKVIYVLEGNPKHRHEALPEYKANRDLKQDDPEFEKKQEALNKFFSQCNKIHEILSNFPIEIIKHPDFECDDTIHNLCIEYCEKSSEDNEVTVVSSDTDFIQLLNRFPTVSLYNAIKKTYILEPTYDYVTWKSLKGDACDNVPGLPGIGEKTATKLVEDRQKFINHFIKHPDHSSLFERNINLIKLHDFSDSELEYVLKSQGTNNFEEVKKIFTEFEFNSIVNDKSWKKFINTFENASK